MSEARNIACWKCKTRPQLNPTVGLCEACLSSQSGSKPKSAQVRNAILAYELLEKVKQILHATDDVAEDGCRLAATVIINLERGTLKDDEYGSLRKLAHNVLRQDPKQQNTKDEPRARTTLDVER